MARDRGEYRGIARALVDGPDFQRLSPDAKLVFLVTKIALGPSGIDVIPALVQATCERTGLPEDRVVSAFVELAETNWLLTEGSVAWVVKGLRFEPGLTQRNSKHRAGVARHITGLPRIALVARFIAEYAEWFDTPPNGYPPVKNKPGIPIRMGIERVSHCGNASQDTHSNYLNLEPKTYTEDLGAEPPKGSAPEYLEKERNARERNVTRRKDGSLSTFRVVGGQRLPDPSPEDLARHREARRQLAEFRAEESRRKVAAAGGPPPPPTTPVEDRQ